MPIRVGHSFEDKTGKYFGVFFGWHRLYTVYGHSVRAARGKKSADTAADGSKSLTGAAVKSNSDDEIFDVTDDVSECQAEALPLVSERPFRAAPAIERRQIAVGDLWSYVADKKLSTTDSLKDEYDVCYCTLLHFFSNNFTAFTTILVCLVRQMH